MPLPPALHRSLALASTLVAGAAFAHSGGVNGHSGKQGATCNACHSGSGALPTLTLSGPASLTTGQVGDYVVTLTGGPGVRAGLNVAAGPANVTFTPDNTSTRTQAFELTHNTAQPFVSGTARFTFKLTAPATAGTFTLYAAGMSANGASGNAGDTYTTRTMTVTVTAGNQAPTLPTAAAASPATVSGTTTQLSALGADDNGEAALVYTWSSASGPAPVTFSVNGTNAAKSTTATFTRAGAYTLRVTARDAGGLTAVSNVSVTVSATAASVTVAPSSVGVAPNGMQAFTATTLDQFGPTTPATVAWAVSGGGAISAAGVFTAAAAAGGPHTVTATANGKSGTAMLTVTAGTAPTLATAARATSASITTRSVGVSVLGADNGGEAALTYTWESAGVSFAPNGTNAAKSSTATFLSPGTYPLLVTVRDATGLTATSTTTVTVVAAVASVTVSPQTGTVAPGGTLQLTAMAVDQFGGALSPAPTLDWSVSGGGTINMSGLFRAGTVAGGPFTVTANAGARQGTATVSVGGSSAPTLAQPPAAYPPMVLGRSTTLHVMGAATGGEAGLTYAWAAAGPGPVTFSENGSNAAKNTVAQFSAAGTHQLTVTLTDPQGTSTTSMIEVSVQQSLTRVLVFPPSAEVQPTGTVQFRADAIDQFDAPMSSPPMAGWASSGEGSIDAAGLFTAPEAGGLFTVSATTAGVRGLARVTVSADAPLAPGAAPARGQQITGEWEGGCTSAPGLLAALAFLTLTALLRRRS